MDRNRKGRSSPRGKTASCLAGLAVVLCVAIRTIIAPTPALACSCVWPTLEQAFAEADVVFAGMPEEGRFPFGLYWSGQRVQVDRVWKGEVPSSVYLTAGEYDPSDGTGASSSCDAGAPLGGRALVFATIDEKGYYYTWTCAGTLSLSRGLLGDDVEQTQFVETLYAEHGPGAPPDDTLATHAPADFTPSPSSDAPQRVRVLPTSPLPPLAGDGNTAETIGPSPTTIAVVSIAAVLLLGGLAYMRSRGRPGSTARDTESDA